ARLRPPSDDGAGRRRAGRRRGRSGPVHLAWRRHRRRGRGGGWRESRGAGRRGRSLRGHGGHARRRPRDRERPAPAWAPPRHPGAPNEADERQLIGATMFGVTTPCVTAARERLEALGYEVLVFHATGTGGRAMEGLVRSGFLSGVLDATTTELADELVGGVLS